MSVRRRAAVWQLAQVIGFLALGALLADTQPQLLVLPLAWVAGIWLHLRTLQCPNCRNPIYRRVVRVFGVTWRYFSPTFPRRYCTQCGFDLSRRPEDVAALRAKAGNRPQRGRNGDVSLGFIRRLPVRQVVVVLVAGIVVNVLTNTAILVLGTRPGSPPWLSWGRWAGAVASALAVGWLVLIRCRRCNQRLGWRVFSSHCWKCGQDLRQPPMSLVRREPG
jgi:hypothetical protein